MAIETAAGRPQTVEWAELLRWTELAQGTMDRAIALDRWQLDAAAIESCLRRGEEYAAKLEPGWPTAKLVIKARERFAAESARRQQPDPTIR